jgi:8-oxo-dGTP pyrophosphatase MutT (NUDIX family)
MSKRTFPGLLDSTVGGSIPTGETPIKCLVREAEEEATIPPHLTKKLARACGTLSYVDISDERGGGETGLVGPEVQYLYEICLPQDITPVPGENEVEAITLMNVEELKAALAKGEFTPANGCVVLEFFVRHGILTAENEPDYVEIVSRLHRKHVYPTA